MIMKQFLSVLFMLSVLVSCQEKRDNYRIIGELKNIPDSSVIDLYIEYEDIASRIDSDTILNGFFEFSGILEKRPAKMMLRMHDWENYAGGCDLWVDYEKIMVTGESRYLSSWDVSSNVKEQKCLNRLTSKTKEFNIHNDSLSLLMMKNRQDRERYLQLRKQADSLRKISLGIEFNMVEKSPNSHSALEILYKTVKFDTTIARERIKKVYEALKPTFKNTLYGEGIKAGLQERDIPEPGDKMIDFTAHDTAGVEYSLSDFKGKYILLDFWSFGCGPCIMSIPEMKELNTQYKDALTIVGINMAANEKQWRKASKRDSIPWTNLSDGKGTIAGLSSVYGIEGVPTYILINSEGVIVEKWMGYWKGVFETKLTNYIDSN